MDYRCAYPLSMQKILPSFWHDFTAESAVVLYQEAFPRASVVRTIRYPTQGLPVFQRGFAGRIMAIDLEIDGFQIQLLNAGDAFRPNPSLSLMVVFDPSKNTHAINELHHAWEVLAKDGRVLMALDTYPFSPLYGWVEDAFGTSWQLIVPDPDQQVERPAIMPSLMFGHTQQGKARTALTLYTEVFDDAQIGTLVPINEFVESTSIGDVIFSEFMLGDQWFVAMDASTATGFTFSPGASLLVRCSCQEEIDQLWDGLSAQPGAEQGGWCRDEFGFSWQIVPDTLADQISRPERYAALIKMKKISIAGLNAHGAD